MCVDVATDHDRGPMGQEVRSEHVGLGNKGRTLGHIDNPAVNQVVGEVGHAHCDFNCSDPLAGTNELFLFVAHGHKSLLNLPMRGDCLATLLENWHACIGGIEKQMTEQGLH